MMPRPPLPYEQKFLPTNGVQLHTIIAGPEHGPLVILLHGFPEFWYSWRYQIAPLAAAGYRVLVPDQRGYNLSTKPQGLGAYRSTELAQDIVGLIDAEGREQANIVGHDWGGVVAWWLALRHPRRVAKLAVLNAPHPTVMRQHLQRSLAQLRKSWYFFFFQLPYLPEHLMRADNWRIGVRALRATARRGTFSEEDFEHYRQAWSQPGAATGMINWYRAMLRRSASLRCDPRVRVPTLLLWGARDRFLGRELAQPSIALCEHGRLIFMEEASHGPQHEEPQRVNEALLKFFGEKI